MVDPDKENLQLISIFHYIVGGLGVLFACIPLIHVTIGLLVVSGRFGQMMTQGHGQPDGFPPAIGWLFVILGGIFFLVGQSVAISMIFAGRFVARRKNYTFVFVISCVECLFIPFGTALGIFSIITLSRDSVKALFEGYRPQPPAVPT